LNGEKISLGSSGIRDEYTTTTQNIEYFEVYNGYKDVFAVTQGVEFNPNYSGEIDLDGIQTFYLMEENGKWGIVDISSFKNVCDIPMQAG